MYLLNRGSHTILNLILVTVRCWYYYILIVTFGYYGDAWVAVPQARSVSKTADLGHPEFIQWGKLVGQAEAETTMLSLVEEREKV